MLLRADTHITRLLDYKLCEELLPSINPTMTNDNINIAFGECDGKGCGKERKEGETGGEMGKKRKKRVPRKGGNCKSCKCHSGVRRN